jgi:hypothetical protein
VSKAAVLGLVRINAVSPSYVATQNRRGRWQLHLAGIRRQPSVFFSLSVLHGPTECLEALRKENH